MNFWIRFFLCFAPVLIIAQDLSPPSHQELIVHNRILATVNGKNISVVDVMKKMDVQLRRNYSEFAGSDTHRFQFFSQNWRAFLNQLVENELMLADASRMEVKIPDSDIREAIHNRFGPNVIATLDELGISHDEAWEMVYAEKAVQQMIGYRVYSKAMHRVGPSDIKVAFQNHLEQNPAKEEWKYQVLSIRAKTEQLGSVFAQKAHSLISNEPLPFDTLATKLQEENETASDISINLSEEYMVEGAKLSEAHKTVLSSLAPGTYSDPIPQKSRRDNTIVHRIFFLKDHITHKLPKLNEMYDDLYDELVQAEIAKELPKYLKKIKTQFNFDETQMNAVPDDFQPFALK